MENELIPELKFLGDTASYERISQKEIIQDPDFGFIRSEFTALQRVHNYVFEKKFLDDADLKMICDEYLTWVTRPLYLVSKNKFMASLNRFVFKFRMLAKRGNHIYANRCRRRIENVKDVFDDALNELCIRKEKRWELNEETSRWRGAWVTNTLFVTLTVNPALFGHNRFKAWVQLEKYYNSFITNLKSTYGCKAFVVKSIESHLSGYPHIHLAVITDMKFKCYRVKYYLDLISCV